MVHMVTNMKLTINKYSQVFTRVGPGYRGFAKFIIIGQYVGLPGEGYNLMLLMLNFI
jgi:hypothetical protein